MKKLPYQHCRLSVTPPYLSDYCVPAAVVDTRQHLRSANRQLLAVPRYRLNTYGCRAFSVASPTVWNCLLDFIRNRPSVQTLSDVCLKRTCSLNTSAFSALEALDDNRTLQIYLLNCCSSVPITFSVLVWLWNVSSR